MATSQKRWYALAALGLCTVAIGLDSTVLSVALPTLARDLGATTGGGRCGTRADGAAADLGEAAGAGRIGSMTAPPASLHEGKTSLHEGKTSLHEGKTSLHEGKTSLRERKKAKTRAAIREHAMRLFEEQGYPATTVDQIADAAEVSPSTFFRYFPTKEDVVLVDDVDAVLIDAVRAQPAGVPPVEAILRGMREVFGNMSPETWEFERRRQRLVLGVPELRARMLHQMTAAIDLVAGVIAERAGLPADDFSARVTAGAAVGAMLAVLPAGRDSHVDGVTPGDYRRLEQALTLLQNGLPLGGE